MMKSVVYLGMICGFLAASPCRATVYATTLSGRITSGTDYAGIFTTAGSSLVNVLFSVEYDLVYPIVDIAPFGDYIDHNFDYGTYGSREILSYANPIFSNVTITVAGKSVSYANNPGYYWLDNNITTNCGKDEHCTRDSLVAHAYLTDGQPFFPAQVQSQTSTGALRTITSVDFAAPVDVTFPTNNVISSTDIYLGPFSGKDVTAHGVNTRLTVRVLDAVPEPATWSMMLAGFGAMGLALRRRRGNGWPVLARRHGHSAA